MQLSLFELRAYPRSVLFIVQVFYEIDLRTRLSLQPIHFHQANKQNTCYLGDIISASLPLSILVSMSFSLTYVWGSETVDDSAEPVLVHRVEVAVFAALSYRLYFGHWVMRPLFPRLSSTAELWPKSCVAQNLSNTLPFVKMTNSLMPIFSLTQTSNFP